MLQTKLVKDSLFSGSGSRIRIQLRIRISDPDPDPDPGFLYLNGISLRYLQLFLLEVSLKLNLHVHSVLCIRSQCLKVILKIPQPPWKILTALLHWQRHQKNSIFVIQSTFHKLEKSAKVKQLRDIFSICVILEVISHHHILRADFCFRLQ